MTALTGREAAKRRLMFVPGEDFYFLTYTLIIVLSELSANAPERPFRDSRKVAYIADLLGGDSDLRLVTTSAPLSSFGKARLALLYDRAVARRAAVQRIVDALHTRGLISIARSETIDCLHLLEKQDVKALLNEPLLQEERTRLKRLRGIIPQLRTMTLETLKQRLFDDREVRTWGD